MPALPKEMVPGLLATGASARAPEGMSARFRSGDAVIARNLNPVGHTRLPRYIKGKHGTVRSDHGIFTFPDTTAHGQGHRPQHLYSVRFMAQELWGATASPQDSVYIDLFDDYLDLDPAGAAPAADEPAPATANRSRGRKSASRRSTRPQRSGRSKVRKARRPGVRLQKAAAKAAPGTPARASRKAAAVRKKQKTMKKAAPAKSRKVVAKSRAGKKPGKKKRLARA